MPVETANKDTLWSDPFYPQQIGAAVDDGPGLAGPRPCKNKHIAARCRCDHLDLGRVRQVSNDSLKRVGRGGVLQQIGLGPEVTAKELILRQCEISQHQLQRGLNSFETQTSVL